MQLHELKSIYKRKKKKFIGRGGKRGTYSGKGQKGQKARAGHRIKPAERLLIAKFPKLRGVKNKSFRDKPTIVHIGDLDKKFKSNDVIDKKVLLEADFIKKISNKVKILDGGNTEKTFIIKDVKISKKAKEKIEKASGNIRL